jgi:hypothetical protein
MTLSLNFLKKKIEVYRRNVDLRDLIFLDLTSHNDLIILK